MAAKSDGWPFGGSRRIEPIDADAARSWLADLRQAAADAEAASLASWLGGDGDAQRTLGAILELSPYLRGEALQHPHWLEAVFAVNPAERVAARIAQVDSLPEEEMGEGAVMTALRLAKREVSFLLALGDLTGTFEPQETVTKLSALADSTVAAALRFGLREARRANKLPSADAADPAGACGLFVLAMGKLGACELNFSSDIDLIVFFDGGAPSAPDRMEATDLFSRVARRLVRILNERTADGYVFRTDLRLRPDPGATPLAISTSAAMSYYESSGRNWERAAMIRARPVAGDIRAARCFLGELSPFVWRKYLDFPAIRDIQSMKTRIDEHRGFDAIGVAGHNVKLGRGGIREIEFFVQAHQLIAGGRAPVLRRRGTEEALAALCEGGWVEDEARAELAEDYWFLRRIEHVLQMIADEQTHTIPETEEEIAAVARLAGFASREAFDDALLATLRRVDRHYTGLFSDGQDRREEGEKEDPVLTRLLADEHEPKAVERLREIGFERPGDIAKIVHDWSTGRYRATRSEAARAELKRALPLVLPAFGKAKDPDAALAAFDRFLSGLPAGVQFFSLITSNPKILDLLTLVISSAPSLRDTLAARPHVFDALIDPTFLGDLPEWRTIAESLDAFLGDASDYEDVLARLRIFASEQRFLIGARMLSGVADIEEAGPAFSDVADLVLDRTLQAAGEEFARRHGRFPGQRVVLLGMGRLGTRELTASSDLDLILIYDHDAGAEESDGEKPLPPEVYYPRLTQRLIAALTSGMREGVLYEVDFRLRPSGRSGPLATSFNAFAQYQEREAWTWEHMALTRSRCVAGDRELSERIEDRVARVLEEGRNREGIAADVASMRERIERDKAAAGPLDLKLRPGGLVDLEFLAQWAFLTGRAELDQIGCPTAEVLAAAFEGGGPDLADAMRRLSSVVQLLRLGPASARMVEDLPSGLADRLVEVLELEAVAEIEPALDDLTQAVRQAFRQSLSVETSA